MKKKTAINNPQPGSVYMMVDALYQPVFMATNSYMPNYDFGEFVLDG